MPWASREATRSHGVSTDFYQDPRHLGAESDTSLGSGNLRATRPGCVQKVFKGSYFSQITCASGEERKGGQQTLPNVSACFPPPLI